MLRTVTRRRIAVLLAAASLIAGGVSMSAAGPASAKTPVACCSPG